MNKLDSLKKLLEADWSLLEDAANERQGAFQQTTNRPETFEEGYENLGLLFVSF